MFGIRDLVSSCEFCKAGRVKVRGRAAMRRVVRPQKDTSLFHTVQTVAVAIGRSQVSHQKLTKVLVFFCLQNYRNGKNRTVCACFLFYQDCDTHQCGASCSTRWRLGTRTSSRWFVARYSHRFTVRRPTMNLSGEWTLLRSAKNMVASPGLGPGLATYMGRTSMGTMNELSVLIAMLCVQYGGAIH